MDFIMNLEFFCVFKIFSSFFSPRAKKRVGVKVFDVYRFCLDRRHDDDHLGFITNQK